MRTLEVTLRIKGLSIERALEQAVQTGMTLKNIRRVGTREVSVCVSTQDEPALTRLLLDSGYGVTRACEADVQRAMHLLKRRAFLSLGAAIFAMIVFWAGACVWSVQITGAGVAEGEIRSLLREEGVMPGRLKTLIRTMELQSEIERRLPQIKYVDVRVKGMTLTVACAQARDAAAAESGGAHGDIIARRDGIITQMLVRSGTPKVKVGDAVQAGQMLVEGVERIGQEEYVRVAARAQIQAQTFYEGAASVRAWEMKTTPTGHSCVRTIIRTPWGEWSKNPPQSFALADVTHTMQLIGGGLFPIMRVIETAQEVTGEKIPRDKATLEVESAKIAAQIAERNIPIDAEVVDKWVDYSMIEEGFCAQVIFSCLEDIALEKPSAPEP